MEILIDFHFFENKFKIIFLTQKHLYICRTNKTNIMKDSKILEKIRKILNKANDPSCTQQEVEAFLATAKRLSTKYNIDSDNIELDESDIVSENIDSNKGRREHSGFEAQFLQVICLAYNCKLIILKKNQRVLKTGKYIDNYRIYGERNDIEIVKTSFSVAVTKFRSMVWDRYKEFQISERDILRRELGNSKLSVYQLEKLGKMPRPSLWCKSYLIGTISGLEEKLKKAKQEAAAGNEEKYGLIVVKKTDLINAHINKKLGKLGTTKFKRSRVDQSAMDEGYKDGKSSDNLRLK